MAIGVPTTMELHNLYTNIEGAKNLEIPNVMITLRDIDTLIRTASRLSAVAINLALHEGLSFEDADFIYTSQK